MSEKKKRIFSIVGAWIAFLFFRFTYYYDIIDRLAIEQLDYSTKDTHSKIELFTLIVELFPIILIVFTIIQIIKIRKGDKI